MTSGSTTLTGTSASTSSPTFGDELLNDVKKATGDAVLAALKIYSGIISAALQQIAQTPSISQLGAEGITIEGNIIAAFPALEQSEIQTLAADAQTDFTQLQTFLQTQASNLTNNG